MFRYRALGSASTLVLCSAFCGVSSIASAQTADRSLPPVTIEAPSPRQALPPARKPAQRTATTSRRKKPVATATAKPPAAQGDGATASLGTPPIKQRF
jgi:iron complex outermembrane receptor protein